MFQGAYLQCCAWLFQQWERLSRLGSRSDLLAVSGFWTNSWAVDNTLKGCFPSLAGGAVHSSLLVDLLSAAGVGDRSSRGQCHKPFDIFIIFKAIHMLYAI